MNRIEYFRDIIHIFCCVKYHECGVLYENVLTTDTIFPIERISGKVTVLSYDYFRINIIVASDTYEWNNLTAIHPDMIVLTVRNYSEFVLHKYKTVIIHEKTILSGSPLVEQFVWNYGKYTFMRVIYDRTQREYDINYVRKYLINPDARLESGLTVDCEDIKRDLTKVYINGRSRPVRDPVSFLSLFRSYPQMLRYLTCFADGSSESYDYGGMNLGHKYATRCCRSLLDLIPEGKQTCDNCMHDKPIYINISKIDVRANLLVQILKNPAGLRYSEYKCSVSGEKNIAQHTNYMIFCPKSFTGVIKKICTSLLLKYRVNCKKDTGQCVNIIDRMDIFDTTPENVTDIIIINKRTRSINKIVWLANNIYRRTNLYIYII